MFFFFVNKPQTICGKRSTLPLFRCFTPAIGNLSNLGKEKQNETDTRNLVSVAHIDVSSVSWYIKWVFYLVKALRNLTIKLFFLSWKNWMLLLLLFFLFGINKINMCTFDETEINSIFVQWIFKRWDKKKFPCLLHVQKKKRE